MRVLSVQYLRIILIVCLGLFGPARGQETTAATDSLLFHLTYQEPGGSATGQVVFTDDVKINKVPPSADTEDTFRGYIKTDPQPDNCMAFFWRINQEKLHLDLNFNGDLTDDPNGVYTSERTGSKQYQSFRNVKLVIPRQGVDYPYLLGSIDLHAYSNGRTYAYISIHSGYHTTITLNNRSWDLTVSDNLDGILNRADKVQLRPSGAGGIRASFDIPSTLFLQDQAYTFDCKYEPQGNEPHIALSLTQNTLPLGQLNLTGQHLEYVLFTSADVTVPIFDPEQSPFTIPIGAYTCQNFRLKTIRNQIRFSPNRIEDEITIATDHPTTFKAGAPLKPFIKATRAGQSIKLDFELRGQAGETYRASSRQNKPGFAIYKGNLKIASGEFEYG